MESSEEDTEEWNGSSDEGNDDDGNRLVDEMERSPLDSQRDEHLPEESIPNHKNDRADLCPTYHPLESRNYDDDRRVVESVDMSERQAEAGENAVSGEEEEAGHVNVQKPLAVSREARAEKKKKKKSTDFSSFFSSGATFGIQYFTFRMLSAEEGAVNLLFNGNVLSYVSSSSLCL
tara:strand:- start:29 stop:556 length:528 start_codon:yes stop_codon:yes gene_type:complete